MIIPHDKLLVYGGNRYIFSRAAMEAVEKIGNIKSYPENESKWKVVPNILYLMLNENLHFQFKEEKEEEKEIEVEKEPKE